MTHNASQSQVDFPLGGVGGGGGGGLELGGADIQRDLLQRTVLAAAAGGGVASGRGVASSGAVGTAGRGEAWPGRLLPGRSGAPVGQAAQAPSLLVRHEGGQFGEGSGGLAQGGGVAGHPARVRVTQLTALGGTVPRHGHVREGADIWMERERGRQGERGR